MMSDALRIVLVDDHPVYRDGLRAIVEPHADIEVVGEATRGDSAVPLVLSLRPDVVLMDLRMPGLDGIAATRRIVAAVPDAAVLVLTMSEDDESVFAAMRAGARGYLLKGADHDDIVRALRSVARGDAVFGPGIAQRVLDTFTAAPPRTAATFDELTEREHEVLALVAEGFGNHRIAHRLSVAPKTVRNHVYNILIKLQASDRADAIARARAAGLGAPDASPGA